MAEVELTKEMRRTEELRNYTRPWAMVPTGGTPVAMLNAVDIECIRSEFEAIRDNVNWVEGGSGDHTSINYKESDKEELIDLYKLDKNAFMNKIINGTDLRFDNEAIRHKILDSIGDLYLAGNPVQGYFYGKKSGHFLNNQLLIKLLSDPNNYEFK